ncbi:hypothetical protein [Sandarakinorhabdus sp. DWP1-3-1]|uniref:hypothetical protein n=1 Tax=Sandarakinorhabdus sp. DWP1-3-1 TaxID=2804627 RepID=UPI003CEADFA1
MLNLKRLPAGIALLGWNTELPSSGTGDPLGMTLRVGARLGAELLHCITSITPRARYYSFFPWAFQRAQHRTEGESDFVQTMRLVLIDERAMTLGAVLHHKGHPCDGGGLQGSNRGVEFATGSTERSIDLSRWSHLRDNTSGFDAYKGSLINLGIFKESVTVSDTENEDGRSAAMSSGELSAKGSLLAGAFDRAVAGTAFVNLGPASASIETDILKEFGGAAGLCELRAADDSDLMPLRDLFFATESDRLNSHYRRRMSLLLLLWATDIAAGQGLEFNVRAFADLTYYRIVFDDEENTVSVTPPPALIDISERWRIFQFHNYLTTALESLLAGLVRAIRDHAAGRMLEEIIEAFDSIESREALGEFLSLELPIPFMDLSPADSLALLGIDVHDEADNGKTSGSFASNPFVERLLRKALVEQDFVSGPAGPLLASLLLYSLILRYDLTVAEAHKGWNIQKAPDQGADVAMPTVFHMLTVDFGEGWWKMANREILTRVLKRFVIRQHETMSYEKGFGGSPPLFRVDGMMVYGTGLTRDEVDPGNPRFPSAMQVLRDLRLIASDPEVGQRLTSDGREMLRFYLEDVIS